MSNYVERQNLRDRQYAEEWKKLSPKKLKELQKVGITGPQMPVYKTGKGDQQSLLESCPSPSAVVTEPDNVRVPDDLSQCREIRELLVEDVAAALRRIMAELMAASRTLDLECVSLVLRLDYDGASMSEIAKRYKVTRAAVSKKVARYTEVLHTGIVPGQRTLTTCKAYARRAYNIHEQNDPHPDRH